MNTYEKSYKALGNMLYVLEICEVLALVSAAPVALICGFASLWIDSLLWWIVAVVWVASPFVLMGISSALKSLRNSLFKKMTSDN